MIEEMMAGHRARERRPPPGGSAPCSSVSPPSAGDVTVANSAETALKSGGPTLSFESIAGREEDVVAQQSRPLRHGGGPASGSG
jgi:hypothetical protein